MKKTLSFIIAVVMLMQMFAFSVSAAAPARVYWSNEYPGEIKFTMISGVKKYRLNLYKNNAKVCSTTHSFSEWENDEGHHNFLDEICENGSGTYKVEVGAYGGNEFTMSNNYVYNKPSKTLAKPSNVVYNKNKQYVTWNEVDGAAFYYIWFCYSIDGENFVNMSGWEIDPQWEGCFVDLQYDMEYIEEEYQWAAEDEGVDVDDLIRAIQIVAYPADLNDANLSYSDYVTFDGSIVETPDEEEITEICDLKWGSEIGSFSFMPASDKDDYYIRLYKNDVEVDGTWYFTEPGQHVTGVKYDNFIYTMVDEGSGIYRFSVCSVDEDLNFNDDVVYSEPYTYNKKTTVSKATNLSFKDNTLSWKNTDSSVSSYAIAYYLTYDEKEYHQLLVKKSKTTEDYLDQSDFDYFNSTIESWHNSNSNKYDKEKAKMVAAVYSVPSNRNTKEMSKSDYCLISGKKELTQVDRSSITDARYVESAKIVYDLGLMENIYENPNATITKGEFCEIVVKMLGAEEVAKGMKDSSSIFSDVTTGTDLNGYVRYLCNKGVINGDGTGAFGVATEFTYAEIVRTLVVMVGYKEYAQSSGGYPTGYLVAANSVGIMSGVSLGVDSTVTREQMGRLAANTIETKLMEVESFTVQGPIYKKTDKTLLFDYMGYVRILGTGYATGNEISIEKNILFSKDYPKGIASADVEIENTDYDAMELNGKRTMFYIKDNKNVCSIQYFGGQVLINNGDAETSNRNVTLTINADGYTKYKFSDGTTFFPITSPISYRLAETDGTQTVRITLANDDESRTQNVSDSIILNNKHKITYKANGRVFKTVEVGCGKSVPVMTERPSFTGYRFDGWETQAPSVMPDYDIVINAKMTPITTVTGKVTVNGVPVADAKVWIGEYSYAQTDASGEFSFDIERGLKVATIKYNDMSKSVFCELNDAKFDLGEIALSAESTEIKVAEESITSVSGAEEIFDEADKEYTKTEGNVVSVKVDVKPATENTSIAQKEAETSYKVETLVDIDITKVKSGTENSQEKITETNKLLEFKFVIPAESRGKSSYAILREHDGKVDMLTTAPNEDGEYIVINQDEIVIYAKKFSTYGIATKEVVSATKTDTGVSFEINLNEQVVKDDAIMIVKAYNKRGVQLASKTIPVTSAYSGEVLLECKDATGYKLMFWGGFDKINPYYAVIDGSL